MALQALSPDYEKHIDYRDAEKNFHGNRVVYVHWEEHLSYLRRARLSAAARHAVRRLH